MTDSLTGSGRLGAARRLYERITFENIIKGISGQEETDDIWYEDADFWAKLLERSEVSNMSPEQVQAEARIFRGLEALVKALDGLETIASLMVISTEYVTAHSYGYKAGLTDKFWLGYHMETGSFGVRRGSQSRTSRITCGPC